MSEITMNLQDDKNDEFSVTFSTSFVNGRMEVTQVNIKAVSDNASVTQKFLRTLPVVSATRAIRRNASTNIDENLDPVTMERWRGTDEQLKIIAELYREAYRTGVPVQPYLATKTGRPVTTVNRWVREARSKGHLGKSNGTRAGEW